MDKKFNLKEFEQRNKHFQDRKKEKIALLQEEMDHKAVEECTFVPNQAPLSNSQMSRAKSASRIGTTENRTI
jgi:hypothetical protein